MQEVKDNSSEHDNNQPKTNSKTVTSTVTIFNTKNSVIRLNPQRPVELFNEDDDDDDNEGDDDNTTDEEEDRERVISRATDICEHLKRHFEEVSGGHQHHVELRQEHYRTHVVDVLSQLIPRPLAGVQAQIKTVHFGK